MSADRFPADLVVTPDDFDACGWKEVLTATTREGYSSIWQAFSAAARKAIADGRMNHGKVLWLLADACSMMLSPSSVNEPFRPFFVMDGERSVVPDDLADVDVAFYAQIVDRIDDIWLKARLADLVWLRQKPRDVRFPLMAIDAYRAIPLQEDTWVRGGHECWERAIILARMLKGGAGERLKEIETAILAGLTGATERNGFLGLWLAELLKFGGLGRDQRPVIAQKLKTLGRYFEGAGDLHRAREYFRAACEWFKDSGDAPKAAEMTSALAEGWVKEAVARLSSANPSHMVAQTFYENAIQAYRTIPRAERATHRADERMVELRAKLNEAGEKSLDEMGVIESPGVDISQLVENARKSVTGKSPLEALKAFTNLHHGVNAKKMRDSALQRIREHPLQALMPATVMSRDGRVIAKRPGMSMGSKLSDDDEIVIRAEMVRDYGILVSIVVQGDIWPALEVLLLEHRLREADFTHLAKQSPVVPEGREGLFSKGLYAGYDRDFVTALHLLLPQIEHMVRVHLKRAGAKTTTLGLNGVENENGLSTLMDLPEVEKVFGADLSFELRALFCDPFGPNLRNELAHGLLDEGVCQSIYGIYAWWFTLRLVFNTWWNANRKSKSGDKETKQA